MTLLRKLASVLCLAFLCTSYSNAEIITVPLANGLSVTISTGTTTQSLQNLNTNPLATNVTMGDDSNVRVPLQFAFPFYGQEFTESWMYSNGAINFKSGNVPGGYCCGGLNLTTLKDPSYNYSIVPLWTDLIALQGGSHYTLGTKTTQTYGWYGVSEYADSSSRNSFEVSIDNTGKINTVFSGAMVNYHPVTSGIIGDVTKDEYYQYYTGNGLTTGAFSWSLPSTGTYDPCKDNPWYSATCPGFSSVLATLSTSTTTTEPIATAVQPPIQETQTAIVVAPVSTGSVALVSPQQSTTATVAVTPTSSPEKAGTPVNLGFALSLIAKNSDREKAFAQQAVSSAIAEAQAAGDRAQQVGGSIATTSASASFTETSASSSSQNVSSMSKTVNLANAANSQTSTVTTNQSFVSVNSQQTSSVQVLAPITLEALQSTQNQSIFSVQQARFQEPESATQSSNFLTDLNNPLKQIIESQQIQQTTEMEQSSSVKRDPAPNELSTGVNLTQMAVIPANYASYTNFVLRDANFYEPKEVYRNQVIIDNVKVLRGLGSDQRHQDLVNSQYK